MKNALALTTLALALTGTSLPAQAQGAGVNIGRLECVVEGGIGLIITSNKQMQCLYKSTTGREESYFGNIRKFGLDIGVTGEAYMMWGVFAPGVVDSGALAGEYVGRFCRGDRRRGCRGECAGWRQQRDAAAAERAGADGPQCGSWRDLDVAGTGRVSTRLQAMTALGCRCR